MPTLPHATVCADAPLPEINGRNPSARGFAERTAVNPPLQATAADLIKLAMVRIDAALQAAGHASAMLLQQRHENRRRRRAAASMRASNRQRWKQRVTSLTRHFANIQNIIP